MVFLEKEAPCLPLPLAYHLLDYIAPKYISVLARRVLPSFLIHIAMRHHTIRMGMAAASALALLLLAVAVGGAAALTEEEEAFLASQVRRWLEEQGSAAAADGEVQVVVPLQRRSAAPRQGLAGFVHRRLR